MHHVIFRALEKVLGNRSLVISRSTFPGSGVFGGHWLGDNESKYRHMQNSITGIILYKEGGGGGGGRVCVGDE